MNETRIETLEKDVESLKKTCDTLFKNQNWLRKELYFTDSLPSNLAEWLLLEFPEMNISPQALTVFIEQKINELRNPAELKSL